MNKSLLNFLPSAQLAALVVSFFAAILPIEWLLPICIAIGPFVFVLAPLAVIPPSFRRTGENSRGLVLAVSTVFLLLWCFVMYMSGQVYKMHPNLVDALHLVIMVATTNGFDQQKLISWGGKIVTMVNACAFAVVLLIYGLVPLTKKAKKTRTDQH